MKLHQKAGAKGGFDALLQPIDAPRETFSCAFHGSVHQSNCIDRLKPSSTYKERTKQKWGQHFSNLAVAQTFQAIAWFMACEDNESVPETGLLMIMHQNEVRYMAGMGTSSRPGSTWTCVVWRQNR